MGNRKAREFMLRQEDEADWQRVRTQVRPAAEDVYARGIGQLRLQLIVCPPFEDGQSWEVRQRQAEWWLFRSRIVSPWPAVQLVGYDPVPIDSSLLSSFFDRVIALTMPIGPDVSGAAGLDGTVTHLAVFGDLHSSCRFQWWSQPPSQWEPLVDLAGEMLEAFTSVSGRLS